MLADVLGLGLTFAGSALLFFFDGRTRKYGNAILTEVLLLRFDGPASVERSVEETQHAQERFASTQRRIKRVGFGLIAAGTLAQFAAIVDRSVVTPMEMVPTRTMVPSGAWELSVFWALAFVLVMSLGAVVVPAALEKLRDSMPIPRPKSITTGDDAWERLISHPDPSGTWVGHCERAVFLTCSLLGSWQFAAAWVVFKVGAKWESWSNIVKVPVPEDGTAEALDAAAARRVWSAQNYSTLVVGTFLNGALAYLGSQIVKLA